MMRQPIDRWLALRRRQRWLAVAAAAGVLAGTLAVFAIRWRQRLADDRRPAGHVVGVLDAATLMIETDRGRIEAPLAGLTCPADWAEPSRRWLAGQAVGRTVMLVRPRDRTRILTDAGWWVYTEAGVFLNERMVDQGYAIAAESPRHDLSRWFGQLTDWARQAGRGRWAE